MSSWNILRAFTKVLKVDAKDETKEEKKVTSPGTLRRLWSSASSGFIDKAKAAEAKEVAKKLEFDDTDGDDTSSYEATEKTRKAGKAQETFDRIEAKSKLVRARVGGWDVMKKDVTEKRRKFLEEELRLNNENPSLAHVMSLAHCLLDAPHHTSDAAYSGAMLMEWAIFRGYEPSDAEQLSLARAHSEIWLARGLAAERYHLERSKVLFDSVLKPTDEWMESSAPWLEYARVLQNMGNRKAAIGILQHIVTTFEGDVELPNYLFYIGGMLKAEGLFDEASNYFFEATSSGPPRFFSKLDMMFIISRNIDEEGSVNGESNEEAYEMVYTHLQQDGLVAADVTYEEWLCNSNTWRMLGDKCALHGMFSLATDLYAQGLMKDTNAFRKPKLWFAFAKACHRCNRDSDAALAVKQALTMDPYNQQLVRASEICAIETHVFERRLEDHITDVLDRMHKHHEPHAKGQLKMQAMFRGKSERRGLQKATGERSDITKKMRDTVGVVLGGLHPLILSAQATWLGTVNSISATNAHGDTTTLKLQHPFTPMAEYTTHPRKLKLVLSAKPDEINKVDRHLLKLRFNDQETGQFVEREMTLSFREHDAAGKLLHTASVGHKEDDVDELDKKLEKEGKRVWTLGDSLRFHDTHDTVTDISEISVEKGGLSFQEKSFLYTVRNEANETVVAILQVSTDRRAEFRMTREHFDRSRHLRKSVQMLIEISVKHPQVASAFFPSMVSDNNVGVISIPGSVKKFRLQIQNADPTSIQGMVVNVKETSGMAIMASHFEKVVEHIAKPMSSEEKLQIEHDEAIGSTSLAKLRLKRVSNIRQNRTATLIKKLSENPGEFDYSDVAKVEKAVVVAQRATDDVSVDSAFKDVADGTAPDQHGHNVRMTKSEDELKEDFERRQTEALQKPKTPDGHVSRKDSHKDIKQRELEEKNAEEALHHQADVAEKSGVDEKGEISGVSKGPLSKSKSKKLPVGDGAESQDDMSQLSQDDLDDSNIFLENSATGQVEDEEGNPIDAEEGSEGDGSEGDEDDSPNPKKKKGGDKKPKKSKKARDKEARDKARKSAMKARLEQSGGLGHMHFVDDEDEEAKKKDREDKKRIQREKMAVEKAKLLALAAERKAKQAAGPITAEAVKEESPKKKKKAQKKAALDAAVFLKHQEARLDASEYLLHRARSLKVKIGTEENSKWLLSYSMKARGVCDELEDTARMDAALAEAEGKKRVKTPLGATAMAVGKFKKKGKLGAKLRKTKAEADAEDVEDATMATEGSLELSVGGDVATVTGDSEMKISVEGEFMGLNLENGFSPTEVQEKANKEEEEEDMILYVKPKKPVLSKYPAFKKPIVMRKRVGKIEMHHKPTMSNKQKQRMLRPLEPNDLPSSAFASAEGLLAALRLHYEGAPEYVEELPAIADLNLAAPSVATEVAPQIGEAGLDESMTSEAGESATPVDPATDLPAASAVAASDAAAHAEEGQTDAAAGAAAAAPVEAAENLPVEERKESPALVRVVPQAAVSPEKLPISPGKKLPINYFHIHALMGSASVTDVSVIEDPHVERFRQIQAAALQKAKDRAAQGRKAIKERELAANPFEPIRVPNNLAFLEPGPGNVDSSQVARDGMNTFKARGYVDGASHYASHWRSRLTMCLELYDSGVILRKSMCSLLKLSPQPLTMLEAFCALADSDGSQIEALGRLSDPEFLREVKTVCALLPVAEILSRLHGALDVEALSVNAFGAGETLDKNADRPSNEAFKRISDMPSMRSLQGTTSQTPTSFESRHQLVKPAPEGVHTGTGGQLRLHTHVAAKTLPHLDMTQSSPITRSRSTKIKLNKGMQPGYVSGFPSNGGSMYTELKTEDGFAVLPATTYPVVAPAVLSGDLHARAPCEPQYQAAPVRSSSPLSFNGSRKSSPKTAGNKSYMRLVNPKKDKMQHMSGEFSIGGMSSLGGNSAKVVPVQAFGKSLRLSAVIDEIFQQSEDSMLVMSRRDALRAAGEEVLSRSTINEFKDKALQRSTGMLNKFEIAKKKKANAHKREHAHGEFLDPNSHQFMHY